MGKRWRKGALEEDFFPIDGFSIPKVRFSPLFSYLCDSDTYLLTKNQVIMKKIVRFLMFGALAVSLTACTEKKPETPAEKAKAAIENLGESVKDATEEIADQAEEAVEQVEEIADEAQDQAKEAKKALEDLKK